MLNRVQSLVPPIPTPSNTTFEFAACDSKTQVEPSSSVPDMAVSTTVTMTSTVAPIVMTNCTTVAPMTIGTLSADKAPITRTKEWNNLDESTTTEEPTNTDTSYNITVIVTTTTFLILVITITVCAIKGYGKKSGRCRPRTLLARKMFPLEKETQERLVYHNNNILFN